MTTKEFSKLLGASKAKEIAIECGYSDGYWRKALHYDYSINTQRLEKMQLLASSFLEKASNEITPTPPKQDEG